ncbi:hypothetical protein [Streptomyces sp. Root1310]|uniref:hypothetical protein n=1 Tax=Streptomyces sp. Root1310 TaxID=1736452 RepID=UPI00070EFABC|nr:hypothetical protein [Streptomyces sp. Root1310]KQX81843.1 hypothetical protein ASD48_00550 [Streptomyces sp. Root1310]
MSIRQITVKAASSGLLRVPARAGARDASRDTLAAGDGRAAHGSGTTGGDAHVTTVTDSAGADRAGADRALGGGERDLTADVGRAPTLHTKIDSAAVADREPARGAGAGRIP